MFTRPLLTWFDFTEWASSEAAQDYFRHHDGESELGRGDDAILKREIYETVSSSEEEKGRDEDEDLRAVLASAPCTEVFTGFGAEQGFVGNVLRFASEVGRERPKGYFGGVVLRSVKGQKGQEKGEGEEGDDVVRLLLGWQSVQAHGDAKGVEGGGEFPRFSFFCSCFLRGGCLWGACEN